MTKIYTFKAENSKRKITRHCLFKGTVSLVCDGLTVVCGWIINSLSLTATNTEGRREPSWLSRSGGWKRAARPGSTSSPLKRRPGSRLSAGTSGQWRLTMRQRRTRCVFGIVSAWEKDKEYEGCLEKMVKKGNKKILPKKLTRVPIKTSNFWDGKGFLSG